MPSDEADIIRAVCAGNSRAYGLLVERYAPRATRLAERLLGTREDAEEAVQDAFVRAYRALQSFEQRSRFSTWFYRILYNVCMSTLKRRGGEAVRLESIEYEAEPADTDLPHDLRMHDEELRRIVEQEVAGLPPPYSSIMTMFLINDQSYDDICRITGLPLGTVKNRLHRARAVLKDAVLRHYRIQENETP